MDITLHIGAHRTGSTMVERAITASIAAHPACGVALWAPRRLRDMKGFQMTSQRLDAAGEPVDRAAAIALDKLASDIARDAADEKARGAKTLILSEENLMGGMRNNFKTGAFYPDVARRLASFDSLLPTSPKTIALGVREYGSVWTSAYHYLPQAGQEPPPIDAIRDPLLTDKRGWPDVVDAVREVWPEVDLIMWRQEDLADHGREICAAVSGLSPEEIVLPKGKINARKAKTPRPEVFTQEERKHLSHRYNRHIKRMKTASNIRWAVA